MAMMLNLPWQEMQERTPVCVPGMALQWKQRAPFELPP